MDRAPLGVDVSLVRGLKTERTYFPATIDLQFTSRHANVNLKKLYLVLTAQGA